MSFFVRSIIRADPRTVEPIRVAIFIGGAWAHTDATRSRKE
jgi:hypothetical protein